MEYRTVAKLNSDEYVVKHSRFIGYAKPVSSKEEAEAFIAEIQSKHWDAKHNALVANVYADKVRLCCKADKELVDECDKIGNGRFFGMAWSEHFGFRNWCEA